MRVYFFTAIHTMLWALPLVAGPKEGAEPLLSDGVWVMKYDDRLDGKVESKPDSDVRWRLTVSKDKVSGKLDNGKGHSLAGEVVDGKPPIIFLRQEGPRGLVCYYSGKLVENGRLVGTWFDNRGGSGDFEMRPEAK
jgi:hypothetical protein